MLRYVDFLFQPLRFSLRCDRGGFLGLYGIAPRASAVYGRSLGGVFLRYMVSARRLEMRKSSHSVAFSVRPCGPPSPYCTMSGGHLIMLVKRIICDFMISNASTHWPSFIVHTLWSVSRFNVQTAPEGGSEQWISRHGVG